MKTLLVINSSGRIARSVTRRLTACFASDWRTKHPESRIVNRDVGASPPSPVDETWIAAAFDESATTSRALLQSESYVDEIVSADAIVMGVPMYNFGIPAQLKAYFDQAIRMGRTFTYDPKHPEPYRPLLPSRPCVVVTSVGDLSLNPGGPHEHRNFLDAHLSMLLACVGVAEPIFVRAEEGLLRNPDALESTLATLNRLARNI